MTTPIKHREGSAAQFAAAKEAAALEPKSLYLIDGKPHLALSTSTAFAFVDTNMVSQMIAGLSAGGEGVRLGTIPGKAPTAVGTPGTSPLAAREDHTHAVQTNISGNANTATTALASNKLTNPQTIRLTGAITGSAQFSGDSDCTIQTSLSSDQTSVGHWFGTESELPTERDPNTIYMVYE